MLLKDKDDPEEVQNMTHSKFESVPIDIYNKILHYINSGSEAVLLCHAIRDLPHLDNAKVLPHSAIPITQFNHKGWGYTTFRLHTGNSCIFFAPKVQNGNESGYIEEI